MAETRDTHVSLAAAFGRQGQHAYLNKREDLYVKASKHGTLKTKARTHVTHNTHRQRLSLLHTPEIPGTKAGSAAASGLNNTPRHA